MLDDPCFGDPLVEAALNLAGGDTVLHLAEEERLGFSEDLLALFQVAMQDSADLGVEEAGDRLSAFGMDGDPFLQQVDVGEVEVDELGESDAGMQEEGDDHEVASRLPTLVMTDGLKQHPLLILGQVDRRFAIVALDADAGGGIDDRDGKFHFEPEYIELFFLVVLDVSFEHSMAQMPIPLLARV